MAIRFLPVNRAMPDAETDIAFARRAHAESRIRGTHRKLVGKAANANWHSVHEAAGMLQAYLDLTPQPDPTTVATKARKVAREADKLRARDQLVELERRVLADGMAVPA